MEYGELDIFLRRNEEWEDYGDEKLNPPAKPIGVPGAYSPSQMHPKYNPPPSPRPQPSPLKGKGKEDKSGLLNAGEHLSEFGIHDAEVSMDDLRALVEELGLGGDDANDLVMGLGTDASKAAKAPETDKPVAKEEAKVEEKPAAEKEPEVAETKSEVKDVKDVKDPEDTKPEIRVEVQEPVKEDVKETKEEIKEEIKEEPKEEGKEEVKDVKKTTPTEEAKKAEDEVKAPAS